MKLSRRTWLAGALLSAPLRAFADPLIAPAERMPLAPCLYVGHGGPNLASSRIRGAELAAWRASLRRPTGIVSITPHVRARGVQLAAVGPGIARMSFPRRFLPPGPPLRYASPDSSALAGRVMDLLAPVAPRETRSGGMNHTTWQPLYHLRPEHDAPVVELALPFTMPDAELFQLGQRLAPLRQEGVWIMASGNLTHNLASMGSRSRPAWADRFDEWTAARLADGDLQAIVEWRSHRDAFVAHPDDGGHFDVLLVVLGAAGDSTVRFPITGFEGALSKRCIHFS